MLLDMDTNALPTTATAVQADLKARADFRGIDEAGQVHYLLGMATQRLAQANTELERYRAALKALVKAIDAGTDAELNEATGAAESALHLTEMGL